MSSQLQSITAVVFAISLLTSCQYQEDVPVPVVIEGNSKILAYLDVPQDISRTSLTDEGKVLWSEGDAFSLLTEKSNDRFEISEGAGAPSATFTGKESGTAPYFAFYPYSEDVKIEGTSLHFKLPQEQTCLDGTFASGASPAISYLATASDNAQFHNLCGILELNLCGNSVLKVKAVEIINLDGKPLWGDCILALDGKQGTDDQTMSVSGGSNVIRIVFDKAVSLKASTPRVVNAVVPAGSFAKGFSIRIFDESGAAISLLTAQSEQVKIKRSFITSMDKLKIPQNGEPLDVKQRGYYKDVFMDGGVNLTSRTSLPACPYLGWSLDYLATSDSILQQTVIVKSENDGNGALLYPDNEPRYRMIYVNGGKANSHAKSLNSTGRNRLQTFVNKGGCYVGSCAGAFLAHSETSTYKYLGIIPATMTSSGLSDSYTGMNIPADSPLLKYGYDFGGDFYVDSVYHNGGGYMKPSNLPAKGQILATFVKPGWYMNGNGSIWSFKANDTKGRVVVTGSHPEGVTSGERRDLMAAMMLYATEGAGSVSEKKELTNGLVCKFDKTSGATAGVGDKQYHHFMVNIPENAKNIKFILESESDIPLHLSLRKDDLAWRTDADFILAQAGSSKTLEIDTLQAGVWYVSVYCPAEITTSCGSGSFKQTGDLKALNGVPYSIQAVWE